MRCEACQGTGWRIRTVPHPYTKEHKPVTLTKECVFCHGKGYVHVIPSACGKDHAANDSEDN